MNNYLQALIQAIASRFNNEANTVNEGMGNLKARLGIPLYSQGISPNLRAPSVQPSGMPQPTLSNPAQPIRVSQMPSRVTLPQRGGGNLLAAALARPSRPTPTLPPPPSPMMDPASTGMMPAMVAGMGDIGGAEQMDPLAQLQGSNPFDQMSGGPMGVQGNRIPQKRINPLLMALTLGLKR